jgi:hypothetical protein
MAGAALGSSSYFRNRSSRGEPTNLWRRMLKGKQRPVRNGSPDRSDSATSNVRIAITAISPDPPESICVSLRPTHIPITLPRTTEKPVTVLRPLSRSSSRAIAPEPTAPRWSVKRDASAIAALSVTFVRSFIHKDWVMMVSILLRH